MKIERRETEPGGQERQIADEEGTPGADGKQLYLRTVYPLNPGIPHFPDGPGGWRRT